VERVEVRGVGGECLRRYLLEPWAAGGQDEPVGLHHLPSLTRQAGGGGAGGGGESEEMKRRWREWKGIEVYGRGGVGRRRMRS